jgi:hypothetical protein
MKVIAARPVGEPETQPKRMRVVRGKPVEEPEAQPPKRTKLRRPKKPEA